MIRKDEKLSMRRQCELLELNRSTIYHQPKGESDENLYIMRMLDKRHLDHPTHGVLQMQDFLFTLGLIVNVKRIRRLLRLMVLTNVFIIKSSFLSLLNILFMITMSRYEILI